MQNCQPITEYQFELAHPESEAFENGGAEQQDAPWILIEVNYY